MYRRAIKKISPALKQVATCSKSSTIAFPTIELSSSACLREFRTSSICNNDKKPQLFKQFTELEKVLDEDKRMLELLSFGTTVEPSDLARHPFYSYDVKLYKMGWDADFNEKEFIEGAKEAFKTIRELLVEDPSQLEPMFTQTAYEGFREWYKFITEEKHCKIVGSLENLAETEILNIRVDSDGETIINVRYKFKEILYLEDEDGNIVSGRRSPTLKIGIVSFYRQNTESDWQVKAVVNPYILNTDA